MMFAAFRCGEAEETTDGLAFGRFREKFHVTFVAFVYHALDSCEPNRGV